MRTAVVILNWNTRDLLSRFLPPLLESSEGVAEVIVADNASTDGSVQLLESEFGGVRRIVLDKNYGFTGGYNRAIAQIADEFEYIVLLNSDIEVHRGWLEPLVAWMDAHRGCGACGPKLHSYYDRDSFEYAGAAGGYVDRFGYPFCRGRVLKRLEKDYGQYDEPAPVLWVSGACLMTRTVLWKEMGGLDDRFFAHMEEIDYCWRLNLAGYAVTVVPESVVYHLGGATLPQSSPFKLKLNFRNNLLMLENNLPGTIGPRRAAFRIFCRKCLDFFSAASYLLMLKPDYFKSVYQAHREYRALKRKSSCRSSVRAVPGYRQDVLVLLDIFRKRDIDL